MTDLAESLRSLGYAKAHELSLPDDLALPDVLASVTAFAVARIDPHLARLAAARGGSDSEKCLSVARQAACLGLASIDDAPLFLRDAARGEALVRDLVDLVQAHERVAEEESAAARRRSARFDAETEEAVGGEEEGGDGDVFARDAALLRHIALEQRTVFDAECVLVPPSLRPASKAAVPDRGELAHQLMEAEAEAKTLEAQVAQQRASMPLDGPEAVVDLDALGDVYGRLRPTLQRFAQVYDKELSLWANRESPKLYGAGPAASRVLPKLRAVQSLLAAFATIRTATQSAASNKRAMAEDRSGTGAGVVVDLRELDDVERLERAMATIERSMQRVRRSRGEPTVV